MKRLFLLATTLCGMLTALGQQDVTVSGSVQSDMLLSTQNEDDKYYESGDFMTNTYLDVLLQSQYIDAGARMEYMEHPLPGFENDFKGWGVPHFWVKGKLDKVELTAGTFYEQFGSGFILRSYEERSLGIDNSLLGGRLIVKPMNGVTLKVLSGKQRHYWKWDGGLVSGADAEVSLDEWIPSLQQHDTRLQDIPYEAPKTVDYSECLKKLDGLVGLAGVKKEISNLAAFLNLQIKRGETNTFQGKHYVFTGNPGTGKTTVARIMTDVFKTLGIVSRGQLVEADRAKLVAGYSGQTAIKTNQLVDQAIGGVLFIDEAYTLKSNDSDSFGSEAIDTLLKRLEDDRGKFICIVAGYTEQMHDFIDTNPGLKSRFTQTIHFDDYTPDELTQIFLNLAKEKSFTIDEPTKAAIHRQFEQLYLRRDKNFGNAREARRIFNEAVEKQSQRLVSLMNDPGFQEEDMYKLTTADLPMAQNEAARPLDEVLNELDEFVGMRSVKNSIRRLAVQSMFMKQRAAMGAGNVQQLAMNFILTGNPGTGKTSIARKMGEVLQAMEILPTSRVIEASRATLVGKYMGETPKIVNNMCDKAMGGILFIDEAYTLSDGGDQYGKEAIDTLMKRMEDDRGKFVVIAAGYKDKMEEFMAINPGLASRFTHKLQIDDYNEDELLAIFKGMAQKEQYTLSQTAEFKALDKIYRMVVNKNESWGNAREMRNLLDATIQRLSMRVSQLKPEEVTKETYQMILPEDIE